MTEESQSQSSRRELLVGGVGIVTALTLWRSAAAAASPAMKLQRTDTAVVFIDPQNDVLSEKGANWGAVGASVTENHTVENMERILRPRR